MRSFLAALIVVAAVASAPAQIPRPAPVVAFDNDGFDLLIRQIRSAKKELVIAIYHLSEPEVVDALLKAKRQQQVAIRIKHDKGQATQEKMTIALNLLREAGVEVTECRGKKGGMYSAMHNKFMVIDGARVITGSQNWSRNAFQDNWENLVLIEDSNVAQRFAQHWKAIQ
jgi:phosphatidylserine/phosphatidylglycerophosphate/cardiolipin synthase-like enzyme